jgi:hypothetical protein
MNAIQKRQTKEKQLLLEQLRKIPIIEIACKNAGVGRATYYRWYKDDGEFQKEADRALDQGKSLINDLAESKLVAGIKDQNMTAIQFWLKHNHENYGTKIEITTNKDDDALSPEEYQRIKDAVAKAKLLDMSGDKHEEIT